MSRTILTINQVVVKGYHECPFAIDIGEQFVAQKKRGSRSTGSPPNMCIGSLRSQKSSLSIGHRLSISID